MKTQVTLLAICLLGAGMANGQTTTNSSSTPGTTTNATYGTSPVTTDSTNLSNSNATTTTNSGTMNNGTMNSSGSVNSAATPTYGTTTTSTDYSSTDRPARVKSDKDYKNFVFGIYAGLNSTKFKGETTNTDGDLSGRLGYQAGFFVRGGGRLYGQIGAEYFASSSNYFTAGSGQTAASIQDQINIKYVQVPVYIGYKLVESDRGISAIRLQVGLEYANQIGSDANQFGDLNDFKIKSGTFNGLGQLGFDAGPVFLDLTYHHGFSDAVSGTGFNGSQRRILSASVGFKF
ncbi:PorT family protein [Spirosoma utsteinense]|uniref:Outer membrane protein beta-barrel domain-containing protein n=1 Tax=Spirosoma utsteinense TaxID=2585773 RepID=A0ABR6W5L5_9BACT|nr:PorT family protein [Spirosoma utsteinense]MBC3786379.1 hypothetical protein [Spirosoma utsteinense]MBC3791428.1 hypothetical protein [Spirosoma utsteinense]